MKYLQLSQSQKIERLNLFTGQASPLSRAHANSPLEPVDRRRRPFQSLNFTVLVGSPGAVFSVFKGNFLKKDHHGGRGGGGGWRG